MKVFTQEEFDNLPVINGSKQCPSGDYTQIKYFKDWCIFGKNCKFGNWSTFSNFCIFGSNCIFGENCNFGECCIFGNRCYFFENCYFGKDCCFGECCAFGKQCSFVEGCRFGYRCYFFENCSFGKDCRFTNDCIFKDNCIFEGHLSKKGYPLLMFGGFGITNGTIYFFNCEDGIWVKSGCFFGSIEQFMDQVKENETSSIAQEYLMITELVKMKWK